MIWVERKAAKIFTLSSKDLIEKYEFFTGKDLGTNLGHLKKLSLSILHWVKFLIKGWMKMKTKKKAI